jgi:hypothetical protein
MKRIEELDSPLNTATELEKYTKKLRDLYHDLYVELEFAAQVLQENLATLPVADSKVNGPMGAANSRIRARRVANQLRRAAEASKYSGGQSVKVWREFVRAFAPEIDAARNPNKKKPTFDVKS